MKILLFIIIGLGLASVGFSQTTNNYPKDTLKFAGYASPDSALETWTWAMTKGDKVVMLQTMTAEAREGKEWAKTLAGATDKQMKSVAAKSASLSGYTIQNRKVISADEVVIYYSMIGHDDVLTMDIKKMGSDWKIAGPKWD